MVPSLCMMRYLRIHSRGNVETNIENVNCFAHWGEAYFFTYSGTNYFFLWSQKQYFCFLPRQKQTIFFSISGSIHSSQKLQTSPSPPPTRNQMVQVLSLDLYGATLSLKIMCILFWIENFEINNLFFSCLFSPNLQQKLPARGRKTEK